MRITNKIFVDKLANKKVTASAAASTADGAPPSDDEVELMVELSGKIIPKQVAETLTKLEIVDTDAPKNSVEVEEAVDLAAL